MFTPATAPDTALRGSLRRIHGGSWPQGAPVRPQTICVTVSKLSEDSLADNDSARDRLAQLGELAAVVAHELRNPLAAVRNGLTYVSQVSLQHASLRADDRFARTLAVMDDELQSCARLIGDLLDFARGKALTLQPHPLRPLVEEAIGLVPAHPHVTLINDVPHDFPPPRIDRDQFRRVIINLVQNAAEAIPQSRAGRVVVHANGGAAEPWNVTVTDDGDGVPAAALPRIFEPMFTTKPRGTGLGLAIVAGIVRRHGGTVSVDETGASGTRIRIELPPGGHA